MRRHSSALRRHMFKLYDIPCVHWNRVDVPPITFMHISWCIKVILAIISPFVNRWRMWVYRVSHPWEAFKVTPHPTLVVPSSHPTWSSYCKALFSSCHCGKLTPWSVIWWWDGEGYDRYHPLKGEHGRLEGHYQEYDWDHYAKGARTSGDTWLR